MCLTGEVISTICAKQLSPIYEADRHAKKELKKYVRGIRAIEPSVGQSNDSTSETVP
jgi:hypothetical protein